MGAGNVQIWVRDSHGLSTQGAITLETPGTHRTLGEPFLPLHGPSTSPVLNFTGKHIPESTD